MKNPSEHVGKKKQAQSTGKRIEDKENKPATTARQMQHLPKKSGRQMENNWSQLGDKWKRGGRQMEKIHECETNRKMTKNLAASGKKLGLTQIGRKWKNGGTQMEQNRHQWKTIRRQMGIEFKIP